MILAAGEGTRLRPLTLTQPKPMVPIVGVPLLARTLTWLAGQGVSECAINLFHRPQSIPDTFGDEFQGVRLHYFFEETLKGTAGGVKAAAALFQDAPFFVIYGDNLIHADLGHLRDFHYAHGGVGMVALFEPLNPTAAGIVGLDDAGRITRFVEKPPADQVFSRWANAGVYVLTPSVLDAIPENEPSDFSRDIFPRLLADGQALYGTPLGGYLQDTGTPDTYRQANWDCLAGRTGVSFPDPHLWVDPAADIGAGVTFAGCNIVSTGAVIGNGASLTDCLLLPGAFVAAGATAQNAIIGDNFTL